MGDYDMNDLQGWATGAPAADPATAGAPAPAAGDADGPEEGDADESSDLGDILSGCASYLQEQAKKIEKADIDDEKKPFKKKIKNLVAALEDQADELLELSETYADAHEDDEDEDEDDADEGGDSEDDSGDE